MASCEPFVVMERLTHCLGNFDGRDALAINGAHAASNRSFFSIPDCTMRMRSGSDVVIRPMACSVSQVANCASSAKECGCVHD
jgi:hypothetical protein